MEQNKYVKPVEATRLTDENIEAACLWLKGLGEIRKDGKGRYIMLLLDGKVAGVGQWIIKDTHGLEYNVLPDEAFQRLYRPEPPSPSPVEVDKPDKLDFILNMTGIKPRIIGFDVFYLTSQVRAILEKWDALCLPASSGETMRWRNGSEGVPETNELFHLAHWRRVVDKVPLMPIGLNNSGAFIAQFGKVYDLIDVEFLDERASPSDTREDAIKFAVWLADNCIVSSGHNWRSSERWAKEITTEEAYTLYTQSLNK